MATLSEDNTSWHSRSIMRRDFRHDPHAVPETPPHRSPGGKKRKHIKGCKHESVSYTSHRIYNHVYHTYRCDTCGKRSYRWPTITEPVVIDPSKKLVGSTWEIIERKKGDPSAD